MTNPTVPFTARRLARVITDALRLTTTYPLGEPIVGLDPTVPGNIGRLFIGDSVTPGGNGLAFLSEVQAAQATATGAQGTANAAQGNATAAQTSANAAAATASSAQTTATAAQTAAAQPKDATAVTYTAGGPGSVQRHAQDVFGQIVSVADFGAKPDYSDSTAAIQAAFTYANTVNGHVYFPPSFSKAWLISGTINIGPNVAGFGGDGSHACTITATNPNYPYFSWPVPTGGALTSKRVRGMTASAQYTSATPTYQGSRFLAYTGDTGGISYSNFEDLAFYALYSGIEINTNYITTAFGKESKSGWNRFDGITCNAGSQSIYPDSAVRWLQGSSTGNYFGKLKGGVNTAFADYQCVGYVVGDITFVGEQLGRGRLFNVVNGTTYMHNISVNGLQTDAGATELFAINRAAGDVIPTMLKVVGSAPSGSSPWSGLAAGLRHSLVSDLGDNGWNAGGVIAAGAETAGTAKQVSLWNVTVTDNGMTVVDVLVEGIVNGLDTGGVLQRFYICCQAGQNLKVYSDAAKQLCTNNGTTPPAGWLAIATGVNGSTVQFAVAYTPQQTAPAGSSLHTSIYARGGELKVQRVSGGVNA